MIDVVSMGPGDAELITPKAMAAIRTADCVVCTERFLPLIDADKFYPIAPLGEALNKIGFNLEAGIKTAVLASGDVGMYGILDALALRFGRENIDVIPGISSPSALLSRLSMSIKDAKIISAHGRGLSPSALCHYARTNEKTVVLLDGQRNPNWVKKALTDGGLGKCELIIGEKISYPDERVGMYEEREYDPLSVALILNPSFEDANIEFGLDDEMFIRSKTPMTKREIRAQILSALRIKSDSVVWDVGSGTGSVSVECARLCPLGQVYAIECDEDACELTRQNARHFNLLNIEVVRGEAPEALKNLPAPTHVFLGGTGGETEEILRLLESLNTEIRLCATAVTMETEGELLRLMCKYEGFSAVQIAVNRLERLGAYHLRRAANPVSVFSADIRS